MEGGKEFIKRALGPVVFVHATPAADAVVGASGLKLHELLRPFSPLQGWLRHQRSSGTKEERKKKERKGKQKDLEEEGEDGGSEEEQEARTRRTRRRRKGRHCDDLNQ